MAELSAVPFSALPSTDDGYTLLNDNGIVHKSSKKLSELVGDDISGKLDKSQYAVDSATFLTTHQDISNKLDTTAFSTVSGDFLTEHQPISANEWNNVYETVVANSGTWGTESDWEPDIISASNNAYNSAVEWVKNQNYLTEHQDISNKMDKSESANFYPMTGNPSGFLTAHQSLDKYATINYVDTEIGKIGSFEVVNLNKDNKPDVNEPSTKIIYLTKEIDSEKSDPYTEWIYNDTTSAWECIGETTLDLANYYKKNETSGAAEISATLDLKEDKLTFAGKNNTITAINNSAIGGGSGESTTYNNGYLINIDSNNNINIRNNNCKANISNYAYAFGTNTTATGSQSFAIGYSTKANGNCAFAEGSATSAQGKGSHAEGYKTYVPGEYSHAEGSATTADGNCAHSEGLSTKAYGYCSHAEGQSTTAQGGNGAHAEGNLTQAIGAYSHAEGVSTTANNNAAHAEGNATKANGDCSHAEGQSTSAQGSWSHSEGYQTNSSGNYAHTEGHLCVAGIYGHAEGYYTTAIGITGGNYAAHAEGYLTLANGGGTHAEGRNTVANSDCAHAEGYQTNANGSYSHTEGWSTSALGQASHAAGKGTIAFYNYETVVGYYNASAHDELSESGKPIFVVGNGKQYTSGHDAFIVTMDGIASATNLQTSAGYVVTDVIITSADNSTTSFVTNGVADLTPLYTYIKSLEDRIAALEAAQVSDVS